jgi:hypothetical protein
MHNFPKKILKQMLRNGHFNILKRKFSNARHDQINRHKMGKSRFTNMPFTKMFSSHAEITRTMYREYFIEREDLKSINWLSSKSVFVKS